MEKKLLFALDIGTRSVVGLVGEQSAGLIQLLGWERQEHHTRAMLDGQIHDVPEVAGVLENVKNRLESAYGPLKQVSVAAAGRALCTVRANAELETYNRGTLSLQDEHALELAAIQSAQQNLATSNAVADPGAYYCVGYSVIGYILDGTSLKTLVGQRGKCASIELIATFLPRQVIDSLQAAIQTVGLEIATLTLEPIAAINVLIPETMRHLNLALVDVGAGTSDVAITRDGSVIGYGMVPCAGDEITEALSQKYLLDFNVAEIVKRKLNGKSKKVCFTDVLGMTHKLAGSEIVETIAPQVAELAQAIAIQILELNSCPPQAVLLVGGGSLTPLLPDALAQALDIPLARVAIRRPEKINGLTEVPAELSTPDAVTPLGILKLSGSHTLNFIHVTLNEEPVRLFNLGRLTVADALLATGLNVRSLQGRPGLGLTITVNGQTRFIPGSLGQPGCIEVNGNKAQLDTPLQEQDVITIIKGIDGEPPHPTASEMIPASPPLTIRISGKSHTLEASLTINSNPASPDTLLQDRDHVVAFQPSSLEEVLAAAAIPSGNERLTYVLNQVEHTLELPPHYLLNGSPVSLQVPVQSQDNIDIVPPVLPTLADILELPATVCQSITVFFNGEPCLLPLKQYSITLDGNPARLDKTVLDGSIIEYSCVESPPPIVSEVLLAGNFNVQSLRPGTKVDILLNGRTTEYTTLVHEGDKIDLIVTP
ncbi:cell division protein ftsa [Lucifera butyrica]|uniref:Cell division protein ftsa n=1 Tax=Lucifera butyrica TaxID=1351585 RepID=A0A498R566_9FIRM|nr:cell division FtsA domain-containing protein [Lucifera butyrica]VBB05967.1 cell division protein ftsa [Lucifera butyrica]